MDEYIKRKDALSAVCKDCTSTHPEQKELCPYKFTGCMEYYNVFDLPAADVTEVVHCKECVQHGGIHSDNECSLITSLSKGAFWISTKPDDFCSSGKRKGDDENGAA